MLSYCELFVTSFCFQEHISYWIVRNSWGSSFGDNGYLYIKMGNNLCGECNIKKPFSPQSGQFQILTKMPNFILWNGKNKKHTVLCEIKAGDKLTFVTGLCSRLFKGRKEKKRRGGCCALCTGTCYAGWKHPVAELFFTCLKFGVLNQGERFCLNVHIIRFHPQTRNLELPFTTLIYSRSKLGL